MVLAGLDNITLWCLIIVKIVWHTEKAEEKASNQCIIFSSTPHFEFEENLLVNLDPKH